MFKLPHNCAHFTCQQDNAQNLSSQASTVCEPRTSRCTRWIQKSRGTSDQIANICWIIEKARKFQKNIYFCFIDYALKPLTVWITTNSGKFLKRWDYQNTPYLPPKKPVSMSRSNSLEPEMEQWAGSKLGEEYIKAVYCHPAYLTYMQSTS